MFLQSVSQKRVRSWILPVFLTVGAMRVYYLREMMAALIIFSALFAFVTGVVLILFLLDRAGQRTLTWAEARTKSFARAAFRVLPPRPRA
jgi:hypothetical protein